MVVQRSRSGISKVERRRAGLVVAVQVLRPAGHLPVDHLQVVLGPERDAAERPSDDPAVLHHSGSHHTAKYNTIS